MVNNTLTDLQKVFLREFFRHESTFFLTGGAALAGFYLGHRPTHDLDLFTLANEVESGFRLVTQVAGDLGATVESIQTSPDFRRLLVTSGEEAIVVDLVHEYVYQVDTDKRVISGIRIDSPEEILANKLCALLSRSEVRDLIDLRALENSGFSLENGLQAAGLKDGGLTAGQLAWVLNQIKFGNDFQPPGGISVGELRTYLADLITRLTHLAYPNL